MFSCTVIQVDMSATSPDNARHLKKHLKSNMAAKPEVVIAPFLLNIFEKFRRLDTCFPARPFKWTCQRHHPTPPDNARHLKTNKNPIWRPKPEVVIAPFLLNIFLKITTARYMFSCTAIQVDMSAASLDNVRHPKNPIWRLENRK